MSVEVAIGALRTELEQLQARAEQIAAAVQLLQPLAPSEQIAPGALAAIIPAAETSAAQAVPAAAVEAPPDGDDGNACSLCGAPATCRTIAHGPLCGSCSGDVPAVEPAKTPPAPRREPSTGQGRDGLSAKEQAVLSFINCEGTTSKAAICKALIEQVSPAYVTQVLSRLVDRELITATGSTSGRRFHSLSPRNEERAKPGPQGKPGAAQAAVEDAGVLRCKILDLVKRDPGLTEAQIRLALPPTHKPDDVTVALVKLRGDGKLTLSMGCYRPSANERGVKPTLGSGVVA